MSENGKKVAVAGRVVGEVSGDGQCRVSSRAMGRRSCEPPPASVYGREQTIYGREPRMQNSRRHSESDPEMALRAEMDAWHDHRAVLADETVDEFHRVDRVLVAEEADRARGRRRPVQHPRMAGGPILEQRPPFVDEKARALEKLLATLERDLGEDLGNCGRRDRRVVLDQGRGRDALARCDDPSDAE